MNAVIENIRAQFPYLERTVKDGRPLVYFDSAATSQKPRCVIELMDEWLADANANVHRAIYGNPALRHRLICLPILSEQNTSRPGTRSWSRRASIIRIWCPGRCSVSAAGQS